MTKQRAQVSQVTELLTRGVEEVVVREHLEPRLRAGKPLRVKLGIDPTGPNIHLGRAITLWKLRAFQDLGHKVVLIIGDFTALIGDPSDKLSKRPMLTPEQVEANLKDYKAQMGKILDLTQVEWRRNSEWLAKLSLIETARLAESFSFQQMAQRRNFKDRLKQDQDISLREFMYPMMQGYDSVVVKADVELGGNDQLFNLLAGRQVQKHYGVQEQDIMTIQMLEGTDGRKMSTSWGNVVNVTDEPNEMYGKLMALKDELIPKYLLLTTRLPEPEILELTRQLKQGANPKLIKSRLAQEVVALYHSARAATQAAQEFDRVHKSKEAPSKIPQVKLPTGKKTMPVTELLVYTKLAASKSEAKRLVEQGGVKVSNKLVKDWQAAINLKPGTVIQVGSRRFVNLV